MKYGFVYLWFDRKHKRFYIGCHWGSTDDSYICSSPWMKAAYKRRPEDFKRRILNTNISTRKELFEQELHWLSMIKKSEIRPYAKTPRYYNLSLSNGHWILSEEKSLTVRQKLSKSLTGRTTYQKGMTLEQIHGPEKAAAIREKFRQAKLGKSPHNKGKSLEESYGAEKAAELRKKNRDARVGKPSTSSSKFQKGHIPWNAKYATEQG